VVAGTIIHLSQLINPYIVMVRGWRELLGMLTLSPSVSLRPSSCLCSFQPPLFTCSSLSWKISDLCSFHTPRLTHSIAWGIHYIVRIKQERVISHISSVGLSTQQNPHFRVPKNDWEGRCPLSDYRAFYWDSRSCSGVSFFHVSEQQRILFIIPSRWSSPWVCLVDE